MENVQNAVRSNGRMTWLMIVGLVVVVGAALAIIGANSGSRNPATSNNTENFVVAPAETRTITVTGSMFKFDPAEIRVKQGDTVKIIFKNAEGFHDFRLEEFSVATKQIQAGQEETVEFVANKTGQFEYYCSVGQHRQMGMKGTLFVE